MPIAPRTLGLACALALSLTWLVAPAGAQDTRSAAGGSRGPGLATVPAEQLQMTTYVAKTVPAQVLYPVVEQFHGRRFVIEGGSDQDAMRNLQLLGDALLIYDSPEVTQRILETLERIDVDQHGNTRPRQLMDADLEVAEFTPRHMSVGSLFDLLGAFRRPYFVRGADGETQQVHNLFMSQQQGLLVARDTPENIATMRELVRRVDVAPPHVTVTCLVLRAGNGGGDARLPQELVVHLSELVGTSDFERVTMGLLTTAVATGSEKLRLSMPGPTPQSECRLELHTEAYDADGPSVTFTSVEFMQSGGSSFSTRATLRAGEWLVLGAAGSDPLFVVLRLTEA